MDKAGGWAQLTTRPATISYRTIWGTSESNVWIVSATSAVFHYDGIEMANRAAPADLVSSESVYRAVGEPGWDVLGGRRNRL